MANQPEDRKVCFVIGPIGAEGSLERLDANWLLEMIVKPAMAKHPEFEVLRADKLSQPGLIDAQVINLLHSAELVIADLTGLNPNAFYEIGIRHMVQKPIIHMIKAGGPKIPFDVSLQRTISFARDTPDEIMRAQQDLGAQVGAVLAPDFMVENPVTSARGRFKLEEHATPGQRVLIQELESLKGRVRLIEQMGASVLARPATGREMRTGHLLRIVLNPDDSISDFRQTEQVLQVIQRRHSEGLIRSLSKEEVTVSLMDNYSPRQVQRTVYELRKLAAVKGVEYVQLDAES